MAPRFDAFGLIATDFEATVDFYRLLGLEFGEIEGEGHIEAELPGGSRLMIDRIEVIQSFSEYTPPSGGHRIGLAFLCDTAAEVDETYARLIAAGHESHVEPFDAFWGQRYATVMDPSGNPVDLFAPLSKTDED